MLFDGLNEIQRELTLGPAALVTSDKNGHAVDRQLAPGYANIGTYKVGGLGAGSITFDFIIGATSETWDASTTYITLRLEESSDSTDGNNGSWTTVVDADLVYDRINVTLVSNEIKLADATTDDNKVYSLGYVGAKRWVRAVVDIHGTQSTGTYIAVIVELGKLKRTPANNAGN